MELMDPTVTGDTSGYQARARYAGALDEGVGELTGADRGCQERWPVTDAVLCRRHGERLRPAGPR